MMEQYKGAPFGELSPHVFAVADASYRLGDWSFEDLVRFAKSGPNGDLFLLKFLC